MPSKKIHIPILYGSQTGNSQSCAESLAESLPETLHKSISPSDVKITSSAKTLDDFLEFDRAKWPRLVMIVCSSYGVGQAPLGCWKFRDLCDEILENQDPSSESKLKGVTYAMLGLGDSKYTTFFLNPTALDSGLSKAGAVRIGSLGKADASGKGDKVQSKVMENWCENIIPDVLRFIKSVVDETDDERDLANESLLKAQDETCQICKKLFDDWDEPNSKPEAKNSSGNNIAVIFSVVLIAILLSSVLNKK